MLTHARSRGSITEATLTSAMIMTTDLVAVLLALWLALLVRFGGPAGQLALRSVVSRFRISQPWLFVVLCGSAPDRQSATRAVRSGENAEVLA
jgi:hypothetical protein